jgi:hypothetical protein
MTAVEPFHIAVPETLQPGKVLAVWRIDRLGRTHEAVLEALHGHACSVRQRSCQRDKAVPVD